MPDKPLWLNRLPDAIAALEQLPVPWVDRDTIQDLLKVRRRRAQQILSPLASRRPGCSTVVERVALIRHLQTMASGETAFYEQTRRKRLWSQVEEERQRWVKTPPAFVQADPEMLRSVYQDDLEGLPAGVDLTPGRIQITFNDPTEALQKLLALAMAIGQNQPAFEERVRAADQGTSP